MTEDYEEFTDSQIALLERYVTNTKDNVFVLRNLPEVIKGALFSRYSRSTLGLRTLLLKEFILNEDTAFDSIIGSSGNPTESDTEDQVVAIKKAQKFYDRILDGYGDDSIGELGGAHLAVEQISMLAAKVVEDCRIGGSPLEKSTRYIYFDQKVNGEYRYYREPVIMTSAYRELYTNTCNMLFECYGKLIPPLTQLIEKKFPQAEGGSKVAYTAALRARVLDCLRGLLPASTLTNMGVYGNGRFFEGLIHKLHCHTLAELQELGIQSVEELSKVIPSFVRRGEINHKHHIGYAKYFESLRAEGDVVLGQHKAGLVDVDGCEAVRLIDVSQNGPVKVAAALLYPHTSQSLQSLYDYCKSLSDEELGKILDIGSNGRENRRHKSPRGLEQATFTFELLADFGVYRDLQRHRILSQQRHLLTCNYGYYVPEELQDTDMLDVYCKAMDQAKEAYDTMAGEFPEEAQYAVPMAYKIRWYFHVNLRALQWLCELRSAPAGHPTYRYLAQAMADQVSQAVPEFERYFRFVDYDGYDLGRLGQEERTAAKQEQPAE